MVNYQNGKIYKIEPIVEHDEGEIYIGSTTKKYLSQRMDNHRSQYKQWKDGKVNKIMSYDIFEKYGVDNCQIILIENCPCETKDELHAREGFHIKENKCVNKCVTGRTRKEHYEDNRDILLQKGKEYKQNNRAQVAVKQKEYQETHKDELREYNRKYQKDNKAKFTEYRKIYIEENKDKIQAINRKCREKIGNVICECGGSYDNNSSKKNRHLSSKKHQDYLNNL